MYGRAVLRLRIAWLGLALVALAAGCDACSCGGVPSSLRGEGAAPFARCTRVHADERSWRAAGLELEIEDDTLQVEGLRGGKARVAFTAGPWPTRGTRAERGAARLAAALKQRVVGVVVVLGGLGDDSAAIVPFLRALARSEAVVVLVPGLTERWDATEDAVAALDDARVIDGAGLRRVVAGRAEVLLLAGSDAGRYGAPAGCGFDDEAVGTLAALERPAGSVRILASMVGARGVAAASAGIGVAGAPAGSRRVAALVQRARVEHMLSAWPTENAGGLPDAGRLEVVVPPAAGLPRVRHDGGRVAPGAVVLTVDGAGVRGELVQPGR